MTTPPTPPAPEPAQPDAPTPPIPLVDLGLQHAQVGAEVEAGWARVLADTAYVLGAEVAEFEREFARVCGVRHCVGVANGTDALELALRAAGVGAGIHYPVPIHLQGAFADLGYARGAFPVAEAAAGRILSLPLYPGITAAQQERVVRTLRKAVGC